MKALWIIGDSPAAGAAVARSRGRGALLGEELRVRLRLGPAKLTLLPRPPKKDRPKREKKPKKQPTDGEKNRKKKAPSITALDILDALPALFESLKAGLRKTRRRLRIDLLRIAVVLGGDDPADVGELYGMVSAAMYTVMPQLERLTYMPDPRIHLRRTSPRHRRSRRAPSGCPCRSATCSRSAGPSADRFCALVPAFPEKFRRTRGADPKTDSADAQPSEEKAAS